MRGQVFWLLSGIGAILFAVTYLPFGSALHNALGADAIISANGAFLADAVASNHKHTIKLSEILAVLKLVSSTDLGISLVLRADIQVGQALHGLTASIEKALWASVASAVVLELWEVLNRLGDWISLYFFRASAITLFVYGLAHAVVAGVPLRKASFALLKLSVLAFSIVYFVLPYTINLTAWLDLWFLNTAQLVTELGLDKLHATVTNTGQSGDITTFWNSGERIKEHLSLLHTEVAPRTSDIAAFFVKYLAYNLATGVVFPLLSFTLFWQIAKHLFGYVEHIQDAQLVGDQS